MLQYTPLMCTYNQETSLPFRVPFRTYNVIAGQTTLLLSPFMTQGTPWTAVATLAPWKLDDKGSLDRQLDREKLILPMF